MNKPAKMSRKDYHNIKDIVRDFLHNPKAVVNFQEYEAFGFKREVHDEGYSNTWVGVSVGDKPGTYRVIVTNNGLDCDGRTSSEAEYVVAKSGKRKRWYNSRNWKTNRPEGKFGIKSRWKVISRENERNRDYTAEAAGY